MAKKRISKLVQWLYAKFLRAIIWEQINNPNSEWDDRAMKILDQLFKYTK